MPRAGNTGAHSAPWHPRPLLRQESRLERGCGVTKVAGKARPRGRPHTLGIAPGPGAPLLPCWRRSAPLERCSSFTRGLDPSLQGAGPAEIESWAGAAGRQTPRKRGRAGAGAGLAREGRARWRSLACPRGGGTRPDSPARRQPKAGPGPPDVGGGDGGQPPPTARQPEPRPGSRLQPRSRATSPLPAAP